MKMFNLISYFHSLVKNWIKLSSFKIWNHLAENICRNIVSFIHGMFFAHMTIIHRRMNHQIERVRNIIDILPSRNSAFFEIRNNVDDIPTQSIWWFIRRYIILVSFRKTLLLIKFWLNCAFYLLWNKEECWWYSRHSLFGDSFDDISFLCPSKKHCY